MSTPMRQYFRILLLTLGIMCITQSYSDQHWYSQLFLLLIAALAFTVRDNIKP